MRKLLSRNRRVGALKGEVQRLRGEAQAHRGLLPRGQVRLVGPEILADDRPGPAGIIQPAVNDRFRVGKGSRNGLNRQPPRSREQTGRKTRQDTRSLQVKSSHLSLASFALENPGGRDGKNFLSRNLGARV